MILNKSGLMAVKEKLDHLLFVSPGCQRRNEVDYEKD